MILSRQLAPHPERIFRIQVQDAMVLHKNLWHPVIGRRQQKAVIEPNLQRPWLQLAIPLRLGITQPQVPFADDRRLIASRLQ